MSIDVLTFGCRLNAYESEVIRRQAQAAGLHDTVVVNTCAVTAEAVRQARQAIRKARRERPHARIVVTGCAAQTEPETFAHMDEVDRVLGNGEKTHASAWAETCAAFESRIAEARTVFWNGPMGVFEWPRFAEGTKAVAAAVAFAKARTVVGGGDSVRAIQEFSLADRIDWVSTGGGASLELLEGKELPGVVAIPAD